MNRGKIIKDIRIELGMNQGQFAAFIGEEQSYISNIESGKMKISFDRMQKMLSAAGYEVEIIIKSDKHKITFNHGSTAIS